MVCLKKQPNKRKHLDKHFLEKSHSKDKEATQEESTFTTNQIMHEDEQSVLRILEIAQRIYSNNAQDDDYLSISSADKDKVVPLLPNHSSSKCANKKRINVWRDNLNEKSKLLHSFPAKSWDNTGMTSNYCTLDEPTIELGNLVLFKCTG